MLDGELPEGKVSHLCLTVPGTWNIGNVGVSVNICWIREGIIGQKTARLRCLWVLFYFVGWFVYRVKAFECGNYFIPSRCKLMMQFNEKFWGLKSKAQGCLYSLYSLNLEITGQKFGVLEKLCMRGLRHPKWLFDLRQGTHWLGLSNIIGHQGKCTTDHHEVVFPSLDYDVCLSQKIYPILLICERGF